MNNLKSYCDRLTEKTIMIFCSDCYSVSEVIGNDNLIIHNLFGGIVAGKNEQDMSYLRHCIEKEFVSQIVFVGHLNCQVLKHLIDDASDIKLWEEARSYIEDLAGEVVGLNFGLHDGGWYLMHRHVALQVKKLSGIPYIREKIERDKLIVTGIVIDDREPNLLEETDLDLFENLNFKLN
ncbi:hypothetical protein GCM10009122_59510 [Fulvivirga kasyanovii]|uniref:Carbonic anhydrase n=1 Tax=Fulvivirga kasyanovii TaxID=396812 RepID=A0ABW9RV92_9BACT|nr:carbonic anhydrase [Fulvivirga kasyanovii]MTI27612.1 hypothetical protein [Fulvivirga kasyanovii]